MIKCKICNTEIASSAKTCPSCGGKNKKPLYKKPWFIIIALFVIIGAIGSNGDDDFDSVNTGIVAQGQETTQNPNVEENISAQEKEEEKVEDNVPTEYKSALKKAKIYSDTMNMSKAGLYNQLTSEYGEKFTAEAAQYAIDNVQADWKENALKKAKTYSDTMNMSKAGVYDQLISEYGEKFTAEEAQYAVDNLQANWKENALKKAQSYQDSMSMSPSAIYDQLISEYGEKFTAEEAQYAIDNLQ